MSGYVELQDTSHFAFLRGASSVEEMFATAALMGRKARAATDRNSLAGIVRAHEAAWGTGVRLVVGCRIDLACGMSLLVYPTNRPGYSRLCRLLSIGKTGADKGKCHLDLADNSTQPDRRACHCTASCEKAQLNVPLSHREKSTGNRC